jgi:hypothetical protein
MRTKSTLEYHYETIGRILVHLINHGLSRLNLDQSDAMQILTDEHRGTPEQVVADFFDCLDWLHDEGLIRVDEVVRHLNNQTFRGIQLTSKGIAVIKANPGDPEIGTNIEKRVTESKGADLGASIYGKIGEFVANTFAGSAKSLDRE